MTGQISNPRNSIGRPLRFPSSQPLLHMAMLPWVAVLLFTATVRPAAAQDSSGIFQRFNSGREVAKTWQTMVEVPVTATPQTTPNARIVANEGISLVTAFRPENRAYFSRSFGYARLEWAPENEVRTAQAITLDMTEILNFRIARTFVLSFGVGLGLMHGVIVERDGGFQARFEPFIPVQLGLALPIGRSFIVGAKIVQSTFLGPGPTLSVSRALVGIGYNY